MLEQRIQQQFFEAADLQYQAAETLARPLAEAAQALVGGITGGGKLLAAGHGGGGALARHFASAMLGRFERERPPLAALALAGDGELSAPAGPGDALAQQVQALGHPGDVLVLVAGTAPAAALAGAVTAAHAREMTVVALAAAGEAAAGWKALLAETDVLVAVPHERAPRVLESQLLALHCLCDAVDLQLMGEQDAS